MDMVLLIVLDAKLAHILLLQGLLNALSAMLGHSITTTTPLSVLCAQQAHILHICQVQFVNPVFLDMLQMKILPHANSVPLEAFLVLKVVIALLVNLANIRHTMDPVRVYFAVQVCTTQELVPHTAPFVKVAHLQVDWGCLVALHVTLGAYLLQMQRRV